MNLIPLRIFASSLASVNCPGGGNETCSTGLPQVNAGTPELVAVLQITFGIVAAISVLVIVISGFRFVISDGNPENTSKARETIVYAAIGLVISLSAEGIVSFVLNKI